MQKLIIKNFRQITEATIEIRDLMFLIGEQASGKSTIAKVVYFCKSLKQDFFDIITHLDKTDIQDVKRTLITTIQNKFAKYFGYTTRYADDFEIVYYFSEEKDYYVKLYKANSLQVRFSSDFWNEINNISRQAIYKAKKHKSQKYATFQLQDQADKTLLSNLIEMTSDLFCDKRNTLFFPAGRNITVSYPEQFQLLFFGSIATVPSSKASDVNTIDVTLMKEFFSYSKFLVDYFSDENHYLTTNSPLESYVKEKITYILQGTYKNDNGHERLFYQEESYVPLNLASSGQQEVIRLVQDLIYILQENESTSRIIEEPETHLFPAAQVALVQLITLVANYTGTQFIVTTHSPFIMTAFNNLLYYKKVMDVNTKAKNDVKEHFGTSSLNGMECESVGIDPNKFQAFALKTNGDTYCKSIFDKETNMIGDNYIDEFSETLYGDFDFMYSKI